MSLVNSRFRSRELMKALNMDLMFISIAINVADMKTLERARPAVAGETEPLEATQTPPVTRIVARASISILHMNHLVARRNMLSADMLMFRWSLNLILYYFYLYCKIYVRQSPFLEDSLFPKASDDDKTRQGT